MRGRGAAFQFPIAALPSAISPSLGLVPPRRPRVTVVSREAESSGRLWRRWVEQTEGPRAGALYVIFS